MRHCNDEISAKVAHRQRNFPSNLKIKPVSVGHDKNLPIFMAFLHASCCHDDSQLLLSLVQIAVSPHSKRLLEAPSFVMGFAKDLYYFELQIFTADDGQGLGFVGVCFFLSEALLSGWRATWF